MVFLQGFLLPQQALAFATRCHRLAHQSQVGRAEYWASCHHYQSSSCIMQAHLRAEHRRLVYSTSRQRAWDMRRFHRSDVMLSHLASSSKKAADRILPLYFFACMCCKSLKRQVLKTNNASVQVVRFTGASKGNRVPCS